MSEYLNKHFKNRSLILREKLKRKYIDFKRISEEEIKDQLPSKCIYFQTFHSLQSNKVDHFKKILEFYLRHFEFITYSQAVAKVQQNQIDGRYMCISADDGYKDFVNASQIFDSYGIRGMIFINPIIIGEKDLNVVKIHCKERLGLEPMEFLSWDELEEIAKRGHEIGNHGKRHLNLTELSDEDLVEEIHSSKEILDERFDGVIHYAWTYGRPSFITEKALNLIYSSGHKSAAGVIRGIYTEDKEDQESNEQCIKRDVFEPEYSLNMIKYFLFQAIKK